ncbi:uncharacterized protein LOC142325665 [Lycorma delicatula]|uniref:uncharacterized protein LOC142325665 n=1 Tax=Lycorma delicatula TaxID=130591 RepID=UPI003F51A90A
MKTDQELAKKILNDNEELIIVIKPSVPVWCVSYMQCHKIDVVHRLCEVLLKLNAIDQYSSVLHSLFDYYYSQNNLKRCSAVVKSALDLNIPLKESYQKRFLILLTTGKFDKSNRKSSTEIPNSINYQINLNF